MKVRSFKINVTDNFGSYQIQCSDSHLVKVLGYPDFCQLLCDFLPEIINEVFGVMEVVPHTSQVDVYKCQLFSRDLCCFGILLDFLKLCGSIVAILGLFEGGLEMSFVQSKELEKLYNIF